MFRRRMLTHRNKLFFIDSFICTVGGRDTWPLLHLFMCDIYVSVTKKPYCAIHPSIAFALHGVLGVGWGGGAGAFPSWPWTCHPLITGPPHKDKQPFTLTSAPQVNSQSSHQYSLPDICSVQTSQGKASGCPQGTEHQTLPPHNNVQWLFLQMLDSQSPHRWPFLQEKQCSHSRKWCWMFNVPYSQY